MCISWTIKGLISFMHGVTMKIRKVSLVGNEEGIESRWTDCLRDVLNDSFGQEADIQR